MEKIGENTSESGKKGRKTSGRIFGSGTDKEENTEDDGIKI